MTKQGTEQGILGSDLHQIEKRCLIEKNILAEKHPNIEFKAIWPDVQTEQRMSTLICFEY